MHTRTLLSILHNRSLPDSCLMHIFHICIHNKWVSIELLSTNWFGETDTKKPMCMNGNLKLLSLSGKSYNILQILCEKFSITIYIPLFTYFYIIFHVPQTTLFTVFLLLWLVGPYIKQTRLLIIILNFVLQWRKVSK